MRGRIPDDHFYTSSQDIQESDSSCLLFAMCSFNCCTMSVTTINYSSLHSGGGMILPFLQLINTSPFCFAVLQQLVSLLGLVGPLRKWQLALSSARSWDNFWKKEAEEAIPPTSVLIPAATPKPTSKGIIWMAIWVRNILWDFGGLGMQERKFPSNFQASINKHLFYRQRKFLVC